MTVAELIEKLRTMPQDAEVMGYSDRLDHVPIDDVSLQDSWPTCVDQYVLITT